MRGRPASVMASAGNSPRTDSTGKLMREISVCRVAMGRADVSSGRPQDLVEFVEVDIEYLGDLDDQLVKIDAPRSQDVHGSDDVVTLDQTALGAVIDGKFHF